MNKSIRCPYLLVADSYTALCVWNGKRNPKGCCDSLVRLMRLGRGEHITGKMLCSFKPSAEMSSQHPTITHPSQ